jgi:predicted DNA-binding transcriptional regulator YafY
MRASRLLSILIILQLRGRATAETLADEFEVSIRTIYRDIDQLSAAGVPVYAERGRAGGFALLDGYRTKLTGLTPAEAQALLLAGAGGAAADLGVGPEAAAAQLKLLASLPPDAGASAQHVASRFHLDPVQWYARTEPLELLPQLASAVWRDRRIRIRYESWKAEVSREADPLGLVLKGGVWYLVAVVKPSKDPRTYRVSNIQSLDVLDTPFKRPARFSLSRHWQKWTTDFETRLISERATVRLSPAGMRLLRDAHPAAWEAARENGRPTKPEGWLKADIPVEAISSSSRQLLRLGADIEVLGPPDLRAAIAKEAATISALYARKIRS